MIQVGMGDQNSFKIQLFLRSQDGGYRTGINENRTIQQEARGMIPGKEGPMTAENSNFHPVNTDSHHTLSATG